MEKLILELIDLGIIDTPLTEVKVDEWFQNVRISFQSIGNTKVTIEFEKCYMILLEHDEKYSKSINSDKSKDFEYFVQDINVKNSEEIYEFEISAWPLNAKIRCKSYKIDKCFFKTYE